MERCEPCSTGRRDGQPCDAATCRCRCHREGRAKVDALMDASLDEARAVPRRRRVGKNAWIETVSLSDVMNGKDKIVEYEAGPEKEKR
jgi:hypothetical protein